MLTLIEQDHITPTEYARMKDEYSEEQLKLEELNKALECSLERGKELGKQEGLEEGALKKAQEVAYNLLQLEPLSVEPIAQIAGLIVEEVLRLKG